MLNPKKETPLAYVTQPRKGLASALAGFTARIHQDSPLGSHLCLPLKIGFILASGRWVAFCGTAHVLDSDLSRERPLFFELPLKTFWGDLIPQPRTNHGASRRRCYTSLSQSRGTDLWAGGGIVELLRKSLRAVQVCLLPHSIFVT